MRAYFCFSQEIHSDCGIGVVYPVSDWSMELSPGVWIRWTGTLEWNGGMDWTGMEWNGTTWLVIIHDSGRV